MHGAPHGLALPVGTVDGAQQPSQVGVAEQISQRLRLTWDQQKKSKLSIYTVALKAAKVRVDEHPGAAASAQALGRSPHRQPGDPQQSGALDSQPRRLTPSIQDLPSLRCLIHIPRH